MTATTASKASKKSVPIPAASATPEIVKPKQKGIDSFFAKKPTITEPSPSSTSSFPIVTPNEKTATKKEDTEDRNLAQAPTPLNSMNIITVEKNPLSSQGNTTSQSSPSELTERTMSSMTCSARDDESLSQKSNSDGRRDDSSVVFAGLEGVEVGIDRLVGNSPSPLRSGSADLHQQLKEEEISSFFISSPSATNISLDHSLKFESGFSGSKKPLSVGISMPSLQQIHSSSAANLLFTDQAFSKDNAMLVDDDEITAEDKELLNELLSSPQKKEEGELPSGEGSARTTGRKRKPTDSFDPTPPTRQRKTKAAKTVVNSKNAMKEGNIEMVEAMDCEQIAGSEVIALEEEYLPNQGKPKSASKATKTAKTPAKPRKPKATAVITSTPNPVSSTDSTAMTTATSSVIPVTPVTPAVAVLPPPLPEEMKLKVDQILEKMNALASEVALFEGKSDYYDQELELDDEKLQADMLTVLCDPSAFTLHFAPSTITPVVPAVNPSTAPVAATEPETNNNNEMEVIEIMDDKPAVVVIVEEPLPTAATTATNTVTAAPSTAAVTSSPLTIHEVSKQIVLVVISRMIQGNSLPLSRLIEKIQTKLSELLQWTETVALQPAENLLTFTEELKRSSSLFLSSTIPTLALRECYGYRQKNALLFEDESIVGVYRWEVHSMQFFTKASQAIIREVRSVRNRYNRALKAMVKVVEQIHKTPNDSTKLPPLEEKVAKAYSEIEKAKERRREYEQKKAIELEGKMKKQEELEKKKKEKEDAELKKKQQLDALAAAKAAAQADKDKQKNEKLQVLEKQKSFFKSFLNKNGSSSSCGAVEEMTASGTVMIDMTAPVVPAVNIHLSMPSSSFSSGGVVGSGRKLRPAVVVDVQAEEEKYNNFIAAIRSEMSFEDITRSRRRKKKRLFPGNRKPKTVRLMVYIPPPNSQFFAAKEEDGTHEERCFSNRIKTLFFHEDHRPGYSGTFSKRSRVINGRRPSEKDWDVLKYGSDNDSEAEWEEEEEGDDIENSAGEEDDELDEEEKKNTANDIVYDDFFREDNDFGSDMDSDGEGIAAVAMPNFARIKEEILGLRFIDHSAITFDNNTPPSSSSSSSSPSSSLSFPMILKVEATNKSGSSSVLFGYKYQSNLEISPIEEVNCREDYDAMVLSNYYPVIYQPQLLALTTEEEERQRNAPKKKKKTASSIATTSDKTENSPSKSDDPENTATIKNQSEIATEKKTPKKKRTKKPDTPTTENTAAEGDDEGEKKKEEGAVKLKKPRNRTPKKKPEAAVNAVTGEITNTPSNTESNNDAAKDLKEGKDNEPVKATEAVTTSTAATTAAKTASTKKKKAPASISTPQAKKTTKTIAEAFSAIKPATLPPPPSQPVIIIEDNTSEETHANNTATNITPKANEEKTQEKPFTTPTNENNTDATTALQLTSSQPSSNQMKSPNENQTNNTANAANKPSTMTSATKTKKRVTPQLIMSTLPSTLLPLTASTTIVNTTATTSTPTTTTTSSDV